MKVVVVGAGFGGLSAACHLAGRGHDVTVLERLSRPGGRAGVWESQGYRFDTGPVVLTMEPYLRAVFSAAGADLEDHVKLLPLDPMYRATFATDGSEILIRRGADAMDEEIREKCGPAAADSFSRFSAWLAELAAVEVPAFIDRNFESVASIAWPPGPLLKLVRLGALRRFDAVVRSYFADERLRRLFSFQALYAGMSPMNALAAFAVITWMDTVEGVWFAEGGLGAVADGLAAAAEKAGAVFAYDSDVAEVERDPRGAATGVRMSDGSRIAADVVVLNADLPSAYRELLPGVEAPGPLRKGAYSPSCVVWLAGTTGTLPAATEHHNIHFGRDWDTAFDQLFRDGTQMSDPSLLVSVPSLTDPSFAPPGAASMYVLEPVPHLGSGPAGSNGSGLSTEAMVQRLRSRVAGLGYPVADDELVVERAMGPVEWAGEGLAHGTPFSLAHRFFQSGSFRPRNVDRRVPGVVFVGSGTVPGVGIPMVLLSGRLAAQRVEEMNG